MHFFFSRWVMVILHDASVTFFHMTNLIKVFVSEKDGRAALITFFDVLSFSSLLRLHILAPEYSHRAPTFTFLISKLTLKISFSPSESMDDMLSALQTRALQDLDVTEPRILSAMPIALAASSRIRPTLDTFRIEYSRPFWIVLSRYVDLRSLRRLAVWNNQYDYVDIKPDWGDLVLLSAAP
ncbi:hypothetical protein DL96DRAFT_882557 [Flagelloscypha sp. PMI_526]|nr:hypothetical protein DL96DRAFT_882557 [Flagelloscypha sp. PMI_526]